MLNPEIIPTTEPKIRVGIILPEDRYNLIIVHTPSSPLYEISSDNFNRKELPENSTLKFNLSGYNVTASLNNRRLGESRRWVIDILNESRKIAYPDRMGLKIENVITGREFHWRKKIDVYLSGTVEVSILKSSLVLINELPLERYLMCVATSEMGSDCPEALIESQTVVARSWLLAGTERKHADLGFDVCNDDCCQRYQGTSNLTEHSIKATLNTYGKVLVYNDKICDTRYSKSCGGVTESFENIWGGQPLPYLKSKPDAPLDFYHHALPLNSENSVREWIEATPDTFCSSKTLPEIELKRYLGSVDEEGQYFRWSFRYSQNELSALLSQQLGISVSRITKLKPIKRGESGRITKIEIDYINPKGLDERLEIENQYSIRKIFHKKFLYSSAFIVDYEDIENGVPKGFVFKGAGWGHGVGLCQIGALGMALKGYSTNQILSHYYQGSVLKKIY